GFEANRMDLPSGDQTGRMSMPGPNVNLESVLRAVLASQILVAVRRSARENAKLAPSGESHASGLVSDKSSDPTRLPLRSNQTASLDVSSGPARYRSTPVCETLKAPRPFALL